MSSMLLNPKANFHLLLIYSISDIVNQCSLLFEILSVGLQDMTLYLILPFSLAISYQPPLLVHPHITDLSMLGYPQAQCLAFITCLYSLPR